MALVASFSGVRGVYGKDLTDSIAVRYAYSYYSFLKSKTKKSNPTIVIGTDTRPSGFRLREAVMGILDCNFIDIGIAPTPAIEFAVRNFMADGGIIITASHNEPYWNGFKFLGSDGSVLNENSMKTIIGGVKRLKDFHKIQERRIYEKNTEAMRDYMDFVQKTAGRDNIENIRKSDQRVVLDPNGGTGVVAKKLLESIGVRVVGVNMQYGEFGRSVEPNEDSLIYLKKFIDDSKSDFAAGFDCDADRLGIVMENGALLSGNQILALMVDDVLSIQKNQKNKVIVTNNATSGIVKKVAEKFGARVKEVEPGEINVINAMDSHKAILGGEGSNGGVIIPPSRCRDGILTIVMVLSITARRQKKLQELLAKLPKFYTLQKKMDFNEKRHDAIKKSLKNFYSKNGYEIKENGGICASLKALKDDSFVWFRASKTESGIFRIITDSQKKGQTETLMGEAVDIFKKANKQ